MSVAFVDTETTGLDPDRCPIWEVAVILPDGPDAGEHCWQIRTGPLIHRPAGEPAPSGTGAYVDQWVLDNTRFADDYSLLTALAPRESAERFAHLMDGRHWVGAVPSFDEERLRRMHNRELGHPEGKYPWHYHLICVEALAVGWLHATGGAGAVALPWNSDDLAEALGVEPAAPEDRHTALGDARWVRRFYEAVMS